MKLRVPGFPGCGLRLERPLLAAALVALTVHLLARLAWGGRTLKRQSGGWLSWGCAVGSVTRCCPDSRHPPPCPPVPSSPVPGGPLCQRLHQAHSQPARRCWLCTLAGAGTLSVWFPACPQGLGHPLGPDTLMGWPAANSDPAAYTGCLAVMRCA